jgi:Peptidase inhibitor family I36
MRKKLLASALASILVAIGASGALATTASASVDQCPPGQVCAFQGPHFTGGFVVLPQVLVDPFEIDDLATVRFDNGQSVANGISSIVDNSNRPLLLANGAGLSGDQMLVGDGNRVDLRTQSLGFGDFDHNVESIVGEPPPSLCPGQICFTDGLGGTGARSIQPRLLAAPFSILNMNNSHFENGQTIAKRISSVVNDSSRDLLLSSALNPDDFLTLVAWVPAGVTLSFQADLGDADNVALSAITVPDLGTVSLGGAVGSSLARRATAAVGSATRRGRVSQVRLGAMVGLQGRTAVGQSRAASFASLHG